MAKKAEQFRSGIDFSKLTKDDLVDFIQIKVDGYNRNRKDEDDLWNLFKNDFKSFTMTILQNRSNKPCLMCSRRNNGLDGPTKALEKPNKTLSTALYTQFPPKKGYRSLADMALKNLLLRSRFTPISQRQPTPMPQGQSTPLSQSRQFPLSYNRESTQISENQQHTRDQGQQTDTSPLSSTSRGFGKLILGIIKSYPDEDKWDGHNGDFNVKLKIFKNLCKSIELPEEAIFKAFPAMLKGPARNHFHLWELSERTFDEACTHLRGFYQDPIIYHQKNLDEWNSITWVSITTRNPENSTYENAQLLIDKLRALQNGLTSNLQTLGFLHNKIVTECPGFPALGALLRLICTTKKPMNEFKKGVRDTKSASDTSNPHK